MKRLLLAILLLGACSRTGPDQERLGDEAWHDGRWAAAVTAYTAAGAVPRIMAKRADAAFQGGQLREAAAAWTRVGLDAKDRAGEAASNLSLVAAAAEQQGDQAALVLAILGLRRVVPGWPLGRTAIRLARASELPPDEAIEILPAALAAAPGKAAVDPLIAALGHAVRAKGDCRGAMPILESALRRSSAAVVREAVSTDLGWCELSLGLEALADSQVSQAERWFDEANHRDGNSAVGRRALVGYGDARLRQGDPASASVAWQTVAVSRAEPDSISELALARLRDPWQTGTEVPRDTSKVVPLP